MTDEAEPPQGPRTPPGVVRVTVRRRPDDEAPAAAGDLAALGVSAVAGGVAAATLGSSLGLWLAVGAAHVALVRPLCRTTSRLRADRARLGAALACPYCKDSLQAGALGCERTGCGALYHRECWDECRAHYGGCAVYGCGGTTAREVGRLALRRRALRLLLAAALFPPRVVRRLRGGERGQGVLRFAWDEAVAVQQNASASCSQSLVSGGVNLALCVGLLQWLIALQPFPPWDPMAVPKVVAIVAVAAVALLRWPFVFQLVTLGAAELAGALASEVAALGRADAADGDGARDTVVGRLARGAGKKDRAG